MGGLIDWLGGWVGEQVTHSHSFLSVSTYLLQEKEALKRQEEGQNEADAASSLLLLERESVQLGKTKVFLRKAAYEVLEHKRTTRLTAATIKLQAFIRGATFRREFLLLRAATCLLQRTLRGMVGRRKAQGIREQKAALLLQTTYRKYAAQKRFRLVVHMVWYVSSSSSSSSSSSPPPPPSTYVQQLIHSSIHPPTHPPIQTNQVGSTHAPGPPCETRSVCEEDRTKSHRPTSLGQDDWVRVSSHPLTHPPI